MYENLYKQIKAQADLILQGVHDVSPERTSAKSAERRGLAARTSGSMEMAMQQVSEQMMNDPRRDPENLKRSMAEYLASLDEVYAKEDEVEGSELPKRITVFEELDLEEIKPVVDFKPSNTGLRLMRDLMKDYGISKEYAAGIVGSLDYETGNFRHMQEIAPLVKGSRGGFGYAQWTGPRRVAFERWARANKLDPTSYEANYGFLKHEISTTREGDFLDEYEYLDDPVQATQVFSKYYLRPSEEHANMVERARRAQAYASVKGF
jgi:hypothetical protein